MKDFNFFSPYLGMKKAHREKYVIGAAAAAVLLLLTGLFWSVEIKKRNLQSEINVMLSFINSPEVLETKQEIQITQKQLEILKEYHQTVEKLEIEIDGMERIGSSLIKELNSKIPKDLFFTNLVLSKDGIHIQGIAGSRISIAELIYNLKNSERFEQVHVSTIQDQTDSLEDGNTAEQFSFMLSCTLKDVMTP